MTRTKKTMMMEAAMVTALEVVERVSSWVAGGCSPLEPTTDHPSAREDGTSVMCPSQGPGEGRVVLAVIDADGSIRRLANPQPVPVDLTTRQKARLRLAGPCRRSACAYWNDSCQLAGAIVSPGDAASELADCSIRGSCRWHLEQGDAACGVCDVVTYRM
jgi:hypothetical protein